MYELFIDWTSMARQGLGIGISGEGGRMMTYVFYLWDTSRPAARAVGHAMSSCRGPQDAPEAVLLDWRGGCLWHGVRWGGSGRDGEPIPPVPSTSIPRPGTCARSCPSLPPPSQDTTNTTSFLARTAVRALRRNRVQHWLRRHRCARRLQVPVGWLISGGWATCSRGQYPMHLWTS